MRKWPMKKISVLRLDELIFKHAFFAKADLFEAIKDGDGLDGNEPKFKGDAWANFFLNASADIWEEIVETHERPKDYEELLVGGNSDEIYGPLLHEIEGIVKQRLMTLFNGERDKILLQKLSGITSERQLDVIFSSEASKRLLRDNAFKEAEGLYLTQNPDSTINKYDPNNWLENSFDIDRVIEYFKQDSGYVELFELCSSRIFNLLYESHFEEAIQDLGSINDNELFQRPAPEYALNIIQTHLMKTLASYYENLLVEYYKLHLQASNPDDDLPF